MHREGRGTRQDSVKAAAFYDMACSGGDDWACGSLGHLHENGEGVKRDGTRAKKLYAIACNAGHKPFCDALEQMGR
jgi:TPR repeat protein